MHADAADDGDDEVVELELAPVGSRIAVGSRAGAVRALSPGGGRMLVRLDSTEEEVWVGADDEWQLVTTDPDASAPYYFNRATGESPAQKLSGRQPASFPVQLDQQGIRRTCITWDADKADVIMRSRNLCEATKQALVAQ